MIDSLLLEKNKTLCISGHRVIEERIDQNHLYEIFLKLIASGIENFLIGMAIGFDTLCFNILEKIREDNKKIKLIACIPCPGQAKKFSYEQKKEYDRMLSSADQKIILSPTYTPYCMIKRNNFMVDNSSILIAYLRENKGGTYSTVKYAKEKGLSCVMI